MIPKTTGSDKNEKGILRQSLTSPKKAKQTVGMFMRELSDDYKFWVNTLAVKGGMGAAGLAVMVATTYALTLPFAIGATIIAVCAAVVGLGLYGAALGMSYVTKRLAQAHRKISGKEEDEGAPAKKSVLQKIAEKPAVAWFLNSPLVQAIVQSKPWKVTGQIVARQKTRILGGMAVGGSALTAGIALWFLAAQVIVLPVVALGSLVTAATAWALGTIVGGVVGMTVAVQNLMKWKREKNENAPAPVAAEIKQTLPENVKGAFDGAAEKTPDNKTPTPVPKPSSPPAP